MEIRASVRENRLSDPIRVTLADYNWYIDHAAIHVWEEEAPDERGGNRYVQPKATAPHSNSTKTGGCLGRVRNFQLVSSTPMNGLD